MKKALCSTSLQLLCAVGLLAMAGCEGSSSKSDGASAGASQTDIPSDWIWVYGPDVSDWPVTITLYGASVKRYKSEYEVTVDYSDRLREIPAWNIPGDPKNVHNVNGTIWLIREYEGQWYIGTIDYLRVGQNWKHFAASPAYYFMPKHGDKVGFMVGTVSREWDGTRSGGKVYRERSNIVWITWDL